MQIGELAKRLHVPYRDVRYVLERGIVPHGSKKHPGKGEHRDLDLGQAFWLAFVLVLKQNGTRTPTAWKIAQIAESCISEPSYMTLDYMYDPFRGHFEAQHRWWIEIAGTTHVRVVTMKGLDDSDRKWPWKSVSSKTIREDFYPLVSLRVDLTELGRTLTA